ncbi:transmembrane protease serine 11D-like [Pollicipes pollicipes]|uniref:transmembrane protease serine 11D-like n=1 Tax=Pollicipes pollicipes TaxID=41117 RepID=UPI001884E811|nr:transmembrane protease serine 11D-like [Pollicipes pollicipes]
MLRVLLLALAVLSADGFSTADVPTPRFTFQPGAIHVTIPSSPGMSLAAIHLTVGEPVHGTRPGKYNKDLARDGDVFRGTVHFQWQTGDVIYYWVYVVVDGLGYQRLEQSHTIRAGGAGTTRAPSRGPFQVPTPSFHFTPFTITVAVPALPGVSLAAIHMNLDEPLRGTNAGKYNKDMDKSGDVFVTMIHAPWEQASTIYYWVYVIFNGLGHHKLEQRFDISPGMSVPPTRPPGGTTRPPSSLLPSECGIRFLDSFLAPAMFGDLRVANASEVNHGDYPWQAQIQKLSGPRYAHHCGGIIISDRHILTAAHCMTLPVSQLQVVVGQHDIRTTNDVGQQTFSIKSLARHADYASDPLRGHVNDIAVILLNTERRGRGIQFDAGDARYAYVSPMCLPSGEDTLDEHTDCLVSGWGQTNGDPSPPVLHGGSLTYISPSYCRSEEVWGDQFDDNVHLCAGNVDGGVDACGGDSGGPLACRNGHGPWIATGIVSWGSDQCGQPRYVGVYTRVSSFVDWIVNTIENVLPNIS